MVSPTSSVPLGTQLATFNAFCKATSPASDHAAVIETWNAMRRLVLPQNNVPIDSFGGLPTQKERVEFFSVKVRSTVYNVLGRRVEELARGVVSKDLCEDHKVTPEKLMQYGAMGLLPLSSVSAFNASAAEYLSRQLDKKWIRMGFVIEDTIGYLKGDSGSHRDLRDFIEVVGFPADNLNDIGSEIEKALRLLVHYGPGRTSSFFMRHKLDMGTIRSAVGQGLISEQSAMEFCNAYTSSVHKVERYQRTMHRLGIAGIIPSGYLLGSFLMNRGMNFKAMIDIFIQNPFVTIPLSLCVIIFGLMTWRPDLFIRD